MQTVQEKVNYLIGQANAFYSSKDFQHAINTAQYILAYLDKNSLEAKNLIEKAKAQLTPIFAEQFDIRFSSALHSIGSE